MNALSSANELYTRAIAYGFFLRGNRTFVTKSKVSPEPPSCKSHVFFIIILNILYYIAYFCPPVLSNMLCLSHSFFVSDCPELYTLLYITDIFPYPTGFTFTLPSANLTYASVFSESSFADIIVFSSDVTTA